MSKSLLEQYLSSAQGLPFFYVVGNVEYRTVFNKLEQVGLQEIRISDFCKKPDKFPSIDDLIDRLHMADINHSSNQYFVTGLGGYLALRGEEETLKVLRALKNTTIGNARVVFLLRFVRNQVKKIASEDIRLSTQRVDYSEDMEGGISVVDVHTSSALGFVKKEGIQCLLQQFEAGNNDVYVKTDLDLTQSFLPVIQIKNSYEAIEYKIRNVSLSEKWGSDENWSRLLNELQQNDFNIGKVLKINNIDEYSPNDEIEKIIGIGYKNWLYFIALKIHCSEIKNSYLKYVVGTTDDFCSFRKNILNAIIKIPHNDSKFRKMYSERKKLLKNIQGVDVAEFVHENEVDTAESIYKYTDNTLLEKEAIIRWVSKYGFIPEINDIYPALSLYMGQYIFKCGTVSHDLTNYFDNYKKQKLQNIVGKEFEEQVPDYAMKYTKLDTRANVLATISDKNNVLLYWIDSLGVEYLSYIQELAKEKGLTIHVDIVRADLPTITSINRSFFDEWPGSKKRKESELDEIKHKDKGGFDYLKDPAPIHLAKELDVIKRAMDFATTNLEMHNYKQVVIASDHGASRLAVIAQREEKYETDTKGEHSGRCCKYFDHDIDNAISENGFVVLTDYGRFKGSRSANVEVHGGASLEETVIPIITLTLKKQSHIDIRILNSNSITIERNKGITVKMYISDINYDNRVSVVVKNQRYIANCSEKDHYSVTIPDIKRSGKYNADIYDGEDLIGAVTLNVKGMVGTANDSFNDLF